MKTKTLFAIILTFAVLLIANLCMVPGTVGFGGNSDSLDQNTELADVQQKGGSTEEGNPVVHDDNSVDV